MSKGKPKRPVNEQGQKFYDFAGQRCQCACLKGLWDQMEVVDALANKCTEYAESYISDEEKEEDIVFVFAQSMRITKWMEEMDRYSELFAATILKGDIVIRWHRGGKGDARTVELSPRRAHLVGILFGLLGRKPIYSSHCAACGREVPRIHYEPWEFRSKGKWSTAVSRVKKVVQKAIGTVRCTISR